MRFACIEIMLQDATRLRLESDLCLIWQQAPASAPAPVAEAGITADVLMPGIAPLSAPAPEAADTVLLDESAAVAPSSEMLLNGSSVALLAQLSSLSEQHFDSHGGSNVTLQLNGFPLAWSVAGASCALLQLVSVTALRSASKVRKHARPATGMGSSYVVLCILHITKRNLERFALLPKAWLRSAGTPGNHSFLQRSQQDPRWTNPTIPTRMLTAQLSDPLDEKLRPQYLQLAFDSARTPAVLVRTDLELSHLMIQSLTEAIIEYPIVWPTYRNLSFVQDIVGSADCSDLTVTSSCLEGSYNASASCLIPAGSAAVVPVVLLEQPASNQSGVSGGHTSPCSNLASCPSVVDAIYSRLLFSPIWMRHMHG